MAISGNGVSNFAYTTDGRAQKVCGIISGGTNAVGGQYSSVTYGTEPGAIAHILTQAGDDISAQDDSQIISG